MPKQPSDILERHALVKPRLGCGVTEGVDAVDTATAEDAAKSGRLVRFAASVHEDVGAVPGLFLEDSQSGWRKVNRPGFPGCAAGLMRGEDADRSLEIDLVPADPAGLRGSTAGCDHKRKDPPGTRRQIVKRGLEDPRIHIPGILQRLGKFRPLGYLGKIPLLDRPVTDTGGVADVFPDSGRRQTAAFQVAGEPLETIDREFLEQNVLHEVPPGLQPRTVSRMLLEPCHDESVGRFRPRRVDALKQPRRFPVSGLRVCPKMMPLAAHLQRVPRRSAFAADKADLGHAAHRFTSGRRNWSSFSRIQSERDCLPFAASSASRSGFERQTWTVSPRFFDSSTVGRGIHSSPFRPGGRVGLTNMFDAQIWVIGSASAEYATTDLSPVQHTKTILAMAERERKLVSWRTSYTHHQAIPIDPPDSGCDLPAVHDLSPSPPDGRGRVGLGLAKQGQPSGFEFGIVRRVLLQILDRDLKGGCLADPPVQILGSVAFAGIPLGVAVVGCAIFDNLRIGVGSIDSGSRQLALCFVATFRCPAIHRRRLAVRDMLADVAFISVHELSALATRICCEGLLPEVGRQAPVASRLGLHRQPSKRSACSLVGCRCRLHRSALSRLVVLGFPHRSTYIILCFGDVSSEIRNKSNIFFRFNGKLYGRGTDGTVGASPGSVGASKRANSDATISAYETRVYDGRCRTRTDDLLLVRDRVYNAQSLVRQRLTSPLRPRLPSLNDSEYGPYSRQAWAHRTSLETFSASLSHCSGSLGLWDPGTGETAWGLTK